MKERFLLFFVIGVLSVVIFIFFFIRTQPIPAPIFSNTSLDGSEQTVPLVTFVNPSRGAANPKITIVEYEDFQCVVCKQMHPIIDIALKTFPDDLRVVWKNMPNTSAHPFAQDAAIAAHCADRQGKFWEFADALFNEQSLLSITTYTQIAQELSLDQTKFSKCVSSQDTLPIINKDLEEGRALGIVATPALFIGDELIIGLQTPEQLINEINRQLQALQLNETSE